VRTILTCEHGGNSIPARYTEAFGGHEELLRSHRGYDPGAKELAVSISGGLKAPLYSSDVSRLLVDMNRSEGHPRLFSEISKGLGRNEKTVILQRYYLPFRRSVESAVERSVRSGQTVLHLSVHSFTPVLLGNIRKADIGLLYDPGRKKEVAFCLRLQEVYAGLLPEFVIRRNYPYAGRSDSLVSSLRKMFTDESYLGIEIEVNQKYPAGDLLRWHELKKIMLKGLRVILKEYCYVI